MKVTDVRLKLLEDRGNLKAAGSITLDDDFVVRGVSVIEGKKGLFVTLPNEKGSDGKYHDTAYPLSKEIRDDINRSVMSEYMKEKELSRLIETVEYNVGQADADRAFAIGSKDHMKETSKPEKVSVKEKLKNAAERVSGQTIKNNEKVKEASL